MPRTKRFKLAPEQTENTRKAIDAWMAGDGHDDSSFAKLIGVKAETVKVNMGRSEYKTKRPISDGFLLRVQRATGLRLVEQAGLPPPAPPAPPEAAASERVVLFLARAVIATASQLALLLHMTRTQFNRLAQGLVSQGIVEREREPAPPSGLARSRQYIYGLSARGRARAQKLLARAPQAAFSRGRLRGALFVTHDLLVTEAALKLVLSAGGQLADWFTSADCRDELRSPNGRSAVEADLVFVVNLASGGCGWVEVETGTGGRKSVEDKVRALEQYCTTGAFRRRWGTDRATVFWIGDNDDHAHQLREWVGPCRPRLMHKFTSWDWVQQSGIAGPIWLRVNGRETRVPLLSGARGEADRPAAASQVLSGGQRT